MSISEVFKELLANLAVDNADVISLRYGEITSVLNTHFRSTDSDTANSLQVGSYGRWTAIKGISDLDMLYIMPAQSWDDYKSAGQYRLLKDAADAIERRYPKTTIKVDRLVVRVLYQTFHVEVQPVFELDDGSFQYPDSYNEGSWKVTKPREEIAAMVEFDAEKNNNLRRLCRMARAWKNKHGVGMGGLLIDTLAHNFLQSTSDYDTKSFLYYDRMSRDFFAYLASLPDQNYHAALGSGQRVSRLRSLSRTRRLRPMTSASRLSKPKARQHKTPSGRRFMAGGFQLPHRRRNSRRPYRSTEDRKQRTRRSFLKTDSRTMFGTTCVSTVKSPGMVFVPNCFAIGCSHGSLLND